MWVFIAQLVEHCSVNAEAKGPNPVKVPKFFGWIFNCLHCKYHCDDHIFISICISAVHLIFIPYRNGHHFKIFSIQVARLTTLILYWSMFECSLEQTNPVELFFSFKIDLKTRLALQFYFPAKAYQGQINLPDAGYDSALFNCKSPFVDNSLLIIHLTHRKRVFFIIFYFYFFFHQNRLSVA